ncbi:MAG: DUF1292 domain-containing protein [Cyanobacteria bacterium TGS_CYA1]|nr:DUF1292 domain-containing protein [Cyanobacteria bacterium TGS_CYA1]MDX2108219.1 DUF1292 domain-containing protein [Candidatus Melainabacteria bacterium]
MNNEPTPGPDDDAIITLEGEDGTSYNCQILDIIEFEGNDYGILLKLKDEAAEAEEDGDDDDESLVIMRLIQKEDHSIFRTIESDDEFDRVVAHVEELARQAISSEEEIV